MSPTKNRKIFFGISIVLVVASIALMLFKGFNLGIDFTGGHLYQIDMGKSVTVDMQNEIEKLASDAFGGQQVNVQSSGDTQVIVKTPELAADPDSETDPDDEASLAFLNSVAESFEDSKVISNEHVGGAVSGRLISDALKAVIIAVVLMLLYITIRFDFQSGTSAVLALAHDIIIMLGFMSLFSITVNSPFIAAVLTILGYSINATIVVFDRIRENGKLMQKATPDEIADNAIRHSYTRAINSSLTTLFSIGALYVLGVSSIREFALPIIVGIVVGTYSSLFVSGSFWAWWKNAGGKKKPAAAKAKK